MASFSFGAAPTTAPTAGFSFGGAPAAAAPTTTFGFGSQQPAATFGTTQPAAASTGFSFGGFGTTPQQPAAASTGFGFGTTPAPAANNAFGFSGFQTQPQPQVQQQQQAASIAPSTTFPASSIEAKVNVIRNAYSASSPDCRFQTVFYNRVEPNTIAQYVKPNNANAQLWEAAVKNNPDPSALVPSLAIGFDDLRKRISEQDKAAAAFNSTLTSMSQSLESMLHSHEASTASALIQLQRVHAQQSHRLLQLVNRVECARTRDVPHVAEEEEFERKLKRVQTKLLEPQPMSSKVAELATTVKRMEKLNEGASSMPSDAVPSWLQADDPSAHQLFTFLQTERIALEHVTSMAKQDQRDLTTIQLVLQQNTADI